MRILMGASKKGKWVPGRFTRQVIGWALALGVIAGLLNPALAAEICISPDPARISAKDMTVMSMRGNFFLFPHPRSSLRRKGANHEVASLDDLFGGFFFPGLDRVFCAVPNGKPRTVKE